MRFSLQLQRSTKWVKDRSGKAITVFAIFTGALAVISPALSPGGWGIDADTSVVTKVVQDLPGNVTEETTITTNSGKTVWDWLGLLGVPLSLFLLGAWFQSLQQKRAAAEKEAQRKQSEYETKEEVLQGYFDRISVLLVDKNLLGIAAKGDATSEQKELLTAAVDVIRARTLSILRRFEFDGRLKGHVIRFLIDTEVISKLKLNLSGANLSNADLREADLREANLGTVNFSHANLSGATFDRAFLQAANFNTANLSYASFFDAILSRADLSGADLSRALLSGSRLVSANLSRANLNGTILGQYTVESIQFDGTTTPRMQFESAVLIGADLSDVTSDDETEWPSKEVSKCAHTDQ